MTSQLSNWKLNAAWSQMIISKLNENENKNQTETLSWVDPWLWFTNSRSEAKHRQSKEQNEKKGKKTKQWIHDMLSTKTYSTWSSNSWVWGLVWFGSVIKSFTNIFSVSQKKKQMKRMNELNFKAGRKESWRTFFSVKFFWFSGWNETKEPIARHPTIYYLYFCKVTWSLNHVPHGYCWHEPSIEWKTLPGKKK